MTTNYFIPKSWLDELIIELEYHRYNNAKVIERKIRDSTESKMLKKLDELIMTRANELATNQIKNPQDRINWAKREGIGEVLDMIEIVKKRE